MARSQIQLKFGPPPAPVDASFDAALAAFHPVVQRWFATKLGEASAPQKQGWPLIREGKDVLIAAPTGSGKTLAAFLACIDDLFRRALKNTLEDKTRIVYVSPLKALGNDVQKNLLGPLREILELARLEGHEPQDVRVGVRSGDTSSSDRAAMLRRPPHILITTPESLYLYLTGRTGRETLRGVETVIVDEIHALARDKRGSHFTLSLQRLKALCKVPPQFVGLSATQKPLERIAQFMTGVPATAAFDFAQCADSPSTSLRASGSSCNIVHVGHQRPWDIKIETPDEEVGAVASHEMWGQVYDRIEQIAAEYRTVLVFTNTRKLAERMAHDLGGRFGQDKVLAHHGSMAKELRLRAEEKLKAGELRVMVATASLELGIDIGHVDIVVQIGTPRSIAVALQRVGRAGHYKGGISRGIFFALTRDDLVECTALLRAIKSGDLDAVVMPEKPLDVLAQQIVAECACDEQDEDALFELFRGAFPYRELSRKEYDDTLTMLSEGVATSRGRARVHIHRDRVNKKLRARKGARITALTNGGAIPDMFTYPVIAEPEGKQVGTLDEDYAVESMAGDVFVLGSTSWRILRVTEGTVRVEDAQGAPPSVPFWRGEAPARTDELSVQVGKFREEIMKRPDAPGWLESELGLQPQSADLLVRYIRSSAAMLGGVPSHNTVIAERFFDEAGGMQLVIHSPFGGRVNRAWGLALRKRFCRTFDFELQAAASDDGILLSLGEQHSFPLADIFGFVTPDNLKEVLEQAILQTPLFGTRFRWNATRALALQRQNGGKRVPPQIQRARSDDLLGAVFPAQLGCQDNHGGMDVELPDHPLVNETMLNCLREAMDVDGLRAVIERIRAGQIQTLAVDSPEPSPLSHQIVHSNPYTYLDEAPLEERRARMVSLRRTLPAEDQVAFGALDEGAIAQVKQDAQPTIRDGDELHDALLALIAIPEEDVHPDHLHALVKAGRATRLVVPPSAEEKPAASTGPRRTFNFVAVPMEKHPAWAIEGVKAAPITIEDRPNPAPPPTGAAELNVTRTFVVCAERITFAKALYPHGRCEPELMPLPGDTAKTADESAIAALRGWMEILGPVTVRELAEKLALSEGKVDVALHALENEGVVLRGTFRPGLEPGTVEWCDRRLLQRIHRLTVGRLRAEIQPLAGADLMRFLFRWHHLEGDDKLRGRHGLMKAIGLLAGYEAPATAWEKWLLPARMGQYFPELLEDACWRGEAAWARLTERDKPAPGPKRGTAHQAAHEAAAEAEAEARRVVLTRNAPLTFCKRDDLDVLLSCARPDMLLADGGVRLPEGLTAAAREVVEVLERRGACFFRDLVAQTRRLPAEVEDALWELLARGVITADAVDNLRVLQSPAKRKKQKAQARGGPGRWSLLQPMEISPENVRLETLAQLFLRRYGIVWRDLVMREALAPSWRDLCFVYRRMEARGEIRGGRFVAGTAGEQFALPEAVDLARSIRRGKPTGERVTLSAVDPLNLTGVVTVGPRVAAIPGHFVTYVDGVPLTVEEREESDEDSSAADPS